MGKILVHACCGPCACSIGTWLPKDNFASFFFCGDNFDTQEEYDKRFAALETVNNTLNNRHVMYTQPYNAKEFLTCEQCIRHRLFECAKVALQNGFDSFTTTLTISPHKNSELINSVGRQVAMETGVPFNELDLKKNDGFSKSVVISKALGLYRQNYCGCSKSVR